MRKCTAKIIDAFVENRDAKTKNMTTNGREIFLFGRRIIEREKQNIYASYDHFLLTMAGYPGVTTKERLNSFLNHLGVDGGFYTKRRVHYFAGVEIGPRDNVRVTASGKVIGIERAA